MATRGVHITAICIDFVISVKHLRRQSPGMFKYVPLTMMIVFGQKISIIALQHLNSPKDMRQLPFFNSHYLKKIHLFTPTPKTTAKFHLLYLTLDLIVKCF